MGQPKTTSLVMWLVSLWHEMLLRTPCRPSLHVLRIWAQDCFESTHFRAGLIPRPVFIQHWPQYGVQGNIPAQGAVNGCCYSCCIWGWDIFGTKFGGFPCVHTYVCVRWTYDNDTVSVCVHSVQPLLDGWDCRKISPCVPKSVMSVLVSVLTNTQVIVYWYL